MLFYLLHAFFSHPVVVTYLLSRKEQEQPDRKTRWYFMGCQHKHPLHISLGSSLYATQSQNTAVQPWLDPATKNLINPNFIVQCAWFQAACNPCSSHGCQCSAILHLLLYVVKRQLTIIEAHPNWPVYADIFEHPSPRLASQRPIWSDMTSLDDISA